MSNVTNEEKCYCPLECDAISYSYSILSSPLDPDILCPKNDIKDDFLMKEFYKNQKPPKLLRQMELYAYNKTADKSDLCRKNMKYRAEIYFRLATNTMSVTVSSRRLSFFDKLSGFGTQES